MDQTRFSGIQASPSLHNFIVAGKEEETSCFYFALLASSVSELRTAAVRLLSFPVLDAVTTQWSGETQ